MQLEISVINKVLKDIEYFSSTNGFTKVSSARTHEGVPSDYDGRQGEYNEDTAVYTHVGLPKDLYLKVTTRTDSYGDGSAVVGLQFVRPIVKQVTDFEAI